MSVYVVEVNMRGYAEWSVRGASAALEDATYLADDLAGPDGDMSVRVTEWHADGMHEVVYRAVGES